MTGFEKRLAELEESLKVEQRKSSAFKFFVFKYLSELEENIDLTNVGFRNRTELASLFKQEELDNITGDLDQLVRLYKRTKKR